MESRVRGPEVSDWKETDPAVAHRRDFAGRSMKLLCDHMLGSLARWLRFMGYDTAYPEPGPDRTLVERARSEGRILLTRDKELARRLPGAIQIRSDDLEEQIREVARVLPLRLIDPLSRCSLCNEVLVLVAPSEVKDLV